MGTDKPLVSIVMAVYHPKPDWLNEQLDSLNEQTYKNLELLVCDDGPDEPVDESVFRERVTAFPWTLVRNQANLGSTKTFELLTGMAGGEYIAYCDQDDVWLSEKITESVDFIHRTDAKLVCSDVVVIDGGGNVKADSITQVRKRHSFHSGNSLAETLLFRNFVIGCTMLLQTSLAREAMPFVEDMVHDHWIALYAATKGRIEVYGKPLLKYRIHEENQTNVLAGVRTKDAYVGARIVPYLNRLLNIKSRLQLGNTLEDALKWVRARKAYSEKVRGAGKELWKLRGLNPTTTMFELVMLRMPEKLFYLAVRCLQKGVL